MRIGLLLPNSNFIFQLARDLRHWVEVGLAEGGLDKHELLIETAAYNESQSAVQKGLQDLSIKQQVDVVIAPLNPSMAEGAKEVMASQGVPLVMLTMGEDIATDTQAPPWVFSNSFGLWRSAWLTGWQAVKLYGPNISIIIGAHDGGYGMGFACALGIEAAGGTVAATLPLILNAGEEQISGQLRAAVDLNSDAIVTFASGDEKGLLMNCSKRIEDLPPLTGIAPAHYFESGVVDEADDFADPCISSWNVGDDQSQTFINSFTSNSDRPAHAYALLAYEAGHLLANAVQSCESIPSGAALRDALQGATYNGPRGEISFDAKTQESITSQYFLNKVSGGNGRSKINKTGEFVDIPDLLEEQIEMMRTNGRKQGWLNPYLVA